MMTIEAWAVRYKNGQIGIHTSKPYHYTFGGELCVVCDTEDCFVLDHDFFPELKFGDEPIKIKLNIERL